MSGPTWGEASDLPDPTLDDTLPAVAEAVVPVPPRYRYLAPLGRGASGEVVRVRDTVLDRPVALKRLRLDAPPGRVSRFRHEARVTASLQHPGIVPIHDLGEDAAGAWFTMRELTGGTLADARARGMDPERRLDAFLQACDAVAAAHQSGVVHLDLKPENIAVGNFGEVAVLDWGVARRLDTDGPQPIVGTPGWIAPEQARGEPAARTADVYSLGRVLAWLMAGSPSPELDAVVGRCIDPSPALRYPDAAALAADVRRWRDGRRVEAMRYTIGADVRRFVRHHRAVTTLGAGASVLVVGLALAALHERNLAVGALAVDLAGRAETAMAAGDLVDAGVLGAASLALRESAPARGAVIAASSAGLPRLVWQLERPLAEVTASRPDDALGELPASRGGPERACTAADLHPDGARIACGTANGVLVIDSRDGTTRTLGDGRVGAVAFSPDGTRLAYGRIVPDGAVVELDLASGRPLRRFEGHARGTWTVSWLPGDRLLSSGDDSRVHVWPDGPTLGAADSVSFHAASPDGRRLFYSLGRWADLERGIPSFLEGGENTVIGAWSPSGATLAGGGGTRDADLRLWDAEGTPRARVAGVLGGVRELVFLSESLLGAAGDDGRIGLWSLGRTRTHLAAHVHAGAIQSMRSAGRRLLSTGQDLTLRLWEVDAEQVWGATVSERVSPELMAVGEWIVVGQEHAALARLDARTLAPVDTLAPVYNPALAELGGRVLAAGMRGELMLDGRVVRAAPLGLYVSDLATDGDRVFVLERGDFTADPPWSAVRVLDGATFTDLDRWSVGAGTRFLSVRDGRVLTGGPREPARLVRWPGGTVEVELPAVSHGYAAGAVGPDTWAVGGTDGRLVVGERSVRAHQGAVTAVALSPDGRMVATGGADHTVRLWSLADLGERARVAVWPSVATSLVFAGDGLVVAWADGGVRRLDLAPLDLSASELAARFCRAWGMRLRGGVVAPVPVWSVSSCG